MRILAAIAHLAVVLGLISVGQRLFGDSQAGWAMATLYLLLPCTAYDVGEFNHVFPTALILWAFVAYRRPVISGILLEWPAAVCSFHCFCCRCGRRLRSARRPEVFCGGDRPDGCTGGGTGPHDFRGCQLVPATVDRHAQSGGHGLPEQCRRAHFLGAGLLPVDLPDPDYRRLLRDALFTDRLARHKTVEHLLAHSTAIIVGTQFWFTQQGGVFVLWYLPLVLMVVFRPRLAHLRPPALDASAASTSTRVLAAGVSPRQGNTASKLHLFR